MSDYPMLISNKLHSFRNFMWQSYYVSIGHASFLTRVLVPSVLEPITLIFESSCSVSFLFDILHALACACKGDVH